ncbi:unnamed protein product, partial [Phaeothamnion confervicola]
MAGILTHAHPVQWDEHGARALPKDIPLIRANFGGREIIKAARFTDVRVLMGTPIVEGVKTSDTPGQ